MAFHALTLIASLLGTHAVALPFNSTFQRWHPTYHFQAPYGWMNDPCAPAFDPRTGLYHLSYQWNPHSMIWANISWGHATSRDLVHWTYDRAPQLVPTTSYDDKGVFTGDLVDTGPEGQANQLSAIYTAVSHLPISYDRPYLRGSEQLSIAVSSDGGKKWARIPQNPIVPGPPEDINVTGWRDPWVQHQPSFDRALDRVPGEFLYGLVSGGIRHVEPASFLYRIPKNNLTDWTYLGPVVNLTDWEPSPSLPHVGINWEVANLFDLGDATFFISGAEGVYLNKTGVVGRGPKRTPRIPLWFAGDVKGEDDKASLVPALSGILDHGQYYAANSFYDPVARRRIVWGWIAEEDIPQQIIDAQGWAGVFSLPRELRAITFSDVTGTYAASLNRVLPQSYLATPNNDHHNVTTLGVRPAAEVAKLRKAELFKAPSIELKDRNPHLLPGVKSLAYEISADVHIGDNVDEVGFILRHTPDGSERTVVALHPKDDIIVVDRSNSTLLQDVNVDAEYGPFLLFRKRDPAGGSSVLEPWQVRIFVDNSMVEVYANDRFVLSSRIYPSEPEALLASIFVSGPEGSETARFENAAVWELGYRR